MPPSGRRSGRQGGSEIHVRGRDDVERKGRIQEADC